MLQVAKYMLLYMYTNQPTENKMTKEQTIKEITYQIEIYKFGKTAIANKINLLAEKERNEKTNEDEEIDLLLELIKTAKSGVQDCIPYTLDAIDWLQGVIDDVEDLQVHEVQQIVHESTEEIITGVNEALDNLSIFK